MTGVLTELCWGSAASDSSEEKTKVNTESGPESRIDGTDELNAHSDRQQHRFTNEGPADSPAFGN